MRRNGWKSISRLTEYAQKAFTNALYYDVFSMIDAGIASGAENYINETTTMPTQATADRMVLYLMEHSDGNDGVMVGLTKYIQALSKMTGFNSEEMLNEIHQKGRLGKYDGVDLYPISSAKKVGGSQLMVPDNRIFGVCGQIGSLTMRGEIQSYQDANNNKECFHLKFAGFTYGIAFNNSTLKKCCKMVIA